MKQLLLEMALFVIAFSVPFIAWTEIMEWKFKKDMARWSKEGWPYYFGLATGHEGSIIYESYRRRG
jgi:hypothetical protein